MDKIVLVIDDNESDVYFMNYAISKKEPSITIESASSGEAGLARLRNGTPLPSIIMLDLKMPGIDGIEVLREIRGDDALRHIPVIVVTHSDMERDLTAAHEAGANSILHKGLSMDRFNAEVASLLDRYL